MEFKYTEDQIALRRAVRESFQKWASINSEQAMGF